jgi:hypothetical protein
MVKRDAVQAITMGTCDDAAGVLDSLSGLSYTPSWGLMLEPWEAYYDLDEMRIHTLKGVIDEPQSDLYVARPSSSTASHFFNLLLFGRM